VGAIPPLPPNAFMAFSGTALALYLPRLGTLKVRHTSFKEELQRQNGFYKIIMLGDIL
jgi:hypothetical protein